MRDVNEPVRIAYANALTQIPGFSDFVFYQTAPNNINPDNYLVFRSISSSDASTKDSAVVDLSITVEIHTKNNFANPGLTADTIADQIFQLVYPDKHTNLTLSRGAIIWTNVTTDRTQDYTLRGQFGYIDRFITFNHHISIGSAGSGGISMTGQGQIFRIEYTGTGGEVGFTDTQLINKRVLAVFKDGIEFSEIITSGSPTNKQALYNSSTGAISTAIPLEPNEEMAVLYQLNNPYQTLVFDYTATGGELSFTSALLVGKQVYGISRDGVSASKILSTGTPVDKQAKYESATGEIEFGIALEPNEQVKILYQL